jgi:Arc/MetJ-type ribon-helix-helix transcriptional regulator
VTWDRENAGLWRKEVCSSASQSILTPSAAIPRLKTVEVYLTDDQKALIRQAVQTGRYASEEDALQEVLSLWEERERRRAEILAAVDQAEASFARGEGRRVTTREETAQLSDDIKRRGRARLYAEENTR